MAVDKMVRQHHRLNGHELSKLWEIVEDRKTWCATVHGVAKSWTRLSGRTTTAVMSENTFLSLLPERETKREKTKI